MRILVLGRNGQLGWAIERRLHSLDAVDSLDRRALDLADRDAIRETLASRRPQLVVNAAVYTAVDRAETERAQAWRVNAEAPAVLANVCAEIGAVLIHSSTDYVFDGRKSGRYVEADRPHPQNAYGRSH